MKQIKRIGILTAGGDCPGLNAAIRGVGKAVLGRNIEAVGIRDGFLGLIENARFRWTSIPRGHSHGRRDDSRHEPRQAAPHGDQRPRARRARRVHRELQKKRPGRGGLHRRDGTQKNAFRLFEKGLAVITLPKTIDNDVAMTDTSFGFDTAFGIATEAIDRLHSTAHSHHRIIVVEVMGHRAGWLTLGCGDRRRRRRHPDSGDSLQRQTDRQGDPAAQRAGLEFQHRRDRRGRAVPRLCGPLSGGEGAQVQGEDRECVERAREELAELDQQHAGNTLRLANRLERLTGLECRVTILGYVQRGGTPSAVDRLLATRLGTACAELIQERVFGVMVAARGEGAHPVPLDQVAGKRKRVPIDHPWIAAARAVGRAWGTDDVSPLAFPTGPNYRMLEQ